MEISKHKKEKMRAVKYTFLLVVLHLGSNSFSQQKSLEGNYNWIGLDGFSSISMKFDKSHFTYESHSDFGQPLISKGYYLFESDTLILFHEKFDGSNPSYFNINNKIDSLSSEFGSKQKINSDRIFISITINNYENLPIVGSQIALMKGDKSLSWFLSDSQGKVFIDTEGRIADRLEIGFIGLQNVSIELSNLWGYFTTANVVLSEHNYNQKEFSEKFILFKGMDHNLRLKSVNSANVFYRKKN